MDDVLTNQLRFLLDKEKQTAIIGYSPTAKEDIFVPKIIEIESIEYCIIGIQSYAFFNNITLNSLSFAEDSEIQFIGNNAFSNSSIRKLLIPASLQQLKEGWCSNVFMLTEVDVSPDNPYFINFNEKILISKSDDEETIIFACRDVKNAVIPSTVTRIGEFSFSYCTKLKILSFEEGTKIRSISKNAFIRSSISEFSIPATVVDLEEGWCNDLRNLVTLNVSPMNDHLTYLEGKILVKKNENEKIVLFARRDIQNARIPSNVKRIGNSAFEHCHNLRSFSLESPTSLEEIGNKSFLTCWILNNFVQIPKSVKKIGEYAFYSCKKLESLSFESGCSIVKFEPNLFGWCYDLKSIIEIPPTLNEICKESFIACINLESLEFLGDEINLNFEVFNGCNHLFVVSFPNAKSVSIQTIIYRRFSKKLCVFTKPGASFEVL